MMWNQRQHMRHLGENWERVPLPQDMFLNLPPPRGDGRLPRFVQCTTKCESPYRWDRMQWVSTRGEGGEVGSCYVNLESCFASLSLSFFLKLK